MALETELTKAGLGDSEARVYLYLLEHGVATPSKIAKGTRILRSNCYHLLQSLKEKGLIEDEKKGKRVAYLARDPNALLASLERKREAVAKLLPDLRALAAIEKNKPSVRFFSGWEEVKELYKLSLLTEECWGLGSLNKLDEVDTKFLDWYKREVAHRKIIYHDVVSRASEKGAKEWREAVGALYTAKLLPAKYPDFNTDILIWDDKIAVVVLEPPIFGTLITSPHLAKTFKTVCTALRESI